MEDRLCQAFKQSTQPSQPSRQHTEAERQRVTDRKSKPPTALHSRSPLLVVVTYHTHSTVAFTTRIAKHHITSSPNRPIHTPSHRVGLPPIMFRQLAFFTIICASLSLVWARIEDYRVVNANSVQLLTGTWSSGMGRVVTGLVCIPNLLGSTTISFPLYSSSLLPFVAAELFRP